MPLENAALHARAATQLAEVRASRIRLVEAADTGRRRVEQDLHDGAQQRLVALALRLRMAQMSLCDREPDEAAKLGAAVDELRTAVDELRELTRGMLPPVLADEGLGIALGSLAARVALPLAIDVPRERFPPEVEATIWFVSCEGVANAVKHADAETLGGSVSRDGGSVHVEIFDDGRGGAVQHPGGGLQGLADRVAAVGGQLRIDALLRHAGIEVVAAVDDAEALIAAVDEHEPDVAVIDIRMPPTHTDEGCARPGHSGGPDRCYRCCCCRNGCRQGRRWTCSGPAVAGWDIC